VVVGVVAFLVDEVLKEVGEAPMSKQVYHSRPEVAVMLAARGEI